MNCFIDLVGAIVTLCKTLKEYCDCEHKKSY